MVSKKGSKSSTKNKPVKDPLGAISTTKKVGMFTAEPDPLTIEPVQPLIQSAIQKESGIVNALGTALENEYDQADLLVLKDDRLRSNIDLFSKMVCRAYQGIDIEQEGDVVNPRELDQNESDMLTTADNLANRLNFKRLFETYTKSLIKYGDLIEHIETDTAFLDVEFEEEPEVAEAITALTSLPINQITIIDEASRIEDPEPSKVITQANIYVIDELSKDLTEDEPIQYPKEEILHISLDKRANWKEDVVHRFTYGIWSDAPIKSVQYLVEWKHNLIRNDMIWRNKMLPREHHKLNMAAFSPENYPGATFSERLSAAKIAATLEMNKYSLSVRNQQPDQGYVTSDDVEVLIIEPKTANYKDVNEQINQIDGKIAALTGTPEALSGGQQMGFSSIEFSGTFVSIRCEEMAELIADGLNRVIWKHLKAVHPSSKIADIKRVKIKTRLILDRDLSERAKVMSMMAGTKVFTPTEIREVFGKEALTNIEQEEIDGFLQSQIQLQAVGKSIGEVTAEAQSQTGTNPTGNQQSKQKRLNDNTSSNLR